MRAVDRMFARYGEFHRNATNKAIHWICCRSSSGPCSAYCGRCRRSVAYVAVAASMVFYGWLSVPLAVGMLGVLALMVYPLTLLGSQVLVVSVVVFVVAWIGQFVGHLIEGRKPAFLEDVRSLLVGPAWLLGFVYKRLGIAF